MIEKDDWRLRVGPVYGNEEKFRNIPLYLHTLPTAFGTLGSRALCVLLG